MLEHNIIEKTYKKLVIQIDPQRLSYAIVDLISNKVIEVFSQKFLHFSNTNKVLENQIKQSLQKLLDQNLTFDAILVLHNNNYNTFIPKAFFDETKLATYLQYNTKVYESDTFVFDALDRYDINNVYVPFININNILLDYFPTFRYKNTNSILVQKILDLSKNKEENLVYIHVQDSHFEIVIVNNQKLVLFNSFEHKKTEDFIYYVLFTFEQLHLNPENIKTYFIGNITTEHSIFKIAYTYIRYVSIYNVNEISQKNGASVFNNLKHFILLQA